MGLQKKFGKHTVLASYRVSLGGIFLVRVATRVRGRGTRQEPSWSGRFPSDIHCLGPVEGCCTCVWRGVACYSCVFCVYRQQENMGKYAGNCAKCNAGPRSAKFKPSHPGGRPLIGDRSALPYVSDTNDRLCHNCHHLVSRQNAGPTTPATSQPVIPTSEDTGVPRKKLKAEPGSSPVKSRGSRVRDALPWDGLHRPSPPPSDGSIVCVSAITLENLYLHTPCLTVKCKGDKFTYDRKQEGMLLTLCMQCRICKRRCVCLCVCVCVCVCV